MLDYEEKRKRSYESYEDITKMVGQIPDVDKPRLLKQIVYGIASLTLELHLIRLMMESKEGWHFDD